MRSQVLHFARTSFAPRASPASYSPVKCCALSSSPKFLETHSETKAAVEPPSEKAVNVKPNYKYYTVGVNLPGQPRDSRCTEDDEGPPLQRERKPTKTRPNPNISGTSPSSKTFKPKTDRPPQPQKDSAATGKVLIAQLVGLREGLAAAKTTPLETLIFSDIPVQQSADGIIKIIQLNRPDQRNALSSKLIDELSGQINSIHAEGDRGPTRAVILASSSAGTWCSGSDMKERQSMNDEEVNAFVTRARETFNRITQLPVPVIAALNGYVLGGGMELALTAHIRYLASNLTMAFPETKSMGIIPGLGGTHRLPQIVARNQALELILTNRRIKTGRASYLGLGTYEPSWATEEKALNLDEEGQREACLARALKTAKDIAQAAPLATRAVLAAMISKERPKGEIEENMAYESLLGTQDRKEALTAFAEKRKPVFVGR